eukprot:403345961
MAQLPFSLMSRASTDDIYDIGSPELCRQLNQDQQEAISTVMSVKLSNFGYFGSFTKYYCIPQQCSELFSHKIERILSRISSLMCTNNQYYLNESTNSDTKLQCQWEIDYPDRTYQRLRSENSQSALILAICLGSYLLIILASTFYDMILRFREDKVSLDKMKDHQQSQLYKDSLNKTILALLEGHKTEPEFNFDEQFETQGSEDQDQGQNMNRGSNLLNNSSKTIQQNSFNKNNTTNHGFSAQGRFWNHRESASNLSKTNDISNIAASVAKPNYAINSSDSMYKQEPSITNFLTEQQSVQINNIYPFINNRENYSYFKVFSVARTFDKLCQTRDLEQKELSILDGIKVLTFMWIWIVYQQQMLLDMNVKNKWRYIEWRNDRYIMFGLAAVSQNGIDIQLAIIGFFATFKLVKIAREYNGLTFSSIFKFFIQRIIRLIPTLYFVFIATWFATYYFTSGNLVTQYQKFFSSCQTCWWTVLLPLNNLVPITQSQNSQCMLWSSFVATDLQLLILAPIITFSFLKQKSLVTVLLYILIGFGTFVYSFLLWSGNFEHGYNQIGDTRILYEFTIKPFIRIDSYIIGISIALYYEKILWFQQEARLKERLQHPFLNWTHKSHIAPFLFLFFSGLCFLINGIIYFNQEWEYLDTNELRLRNAALLGIGKLILLIGFFSFVLFIFIHKPSLLQNILGSYMMQSLSKLTYGAFLIMPIMSIIYQAQMRQNVITISFWEIILQFSFSLCCAFGVSFLLYLLIEQPISDFIQLVLHDMLNFKRKEKQQQSLQATNEKQQSSYQK